MLTILNKLIFTQPTKQDRNVRVHNVLKLRVAIFSLILTTANLSWASPAPGPGLTEDSSSSSGEDDADRAPADCASEGIDDAEIIDLLTGADARAEEERRSFSSSYSASGAASAAFYAISESGPSSASVVVADPSSPPDLSEGLSALVSRMGLDEDDGRSVPAPSARLHYRARRGAAVRPEAREPRVPLLRKRPCSDPHSSPSLFPRKDDDDDEDRDGGCPTIKRLRSGYTAPPNSPVSFH